MAYVAVADFRSATVAEFAIDVAMTTTEISDALLTSLITRIGQRVDELVNDHFEPQENVTLELDGDGTERLYLPRRTRAIDSISTRDSEGVLTAEDVVWRLHSSLDSAGTSRVGDFDWLDIIPGQALSTGSVWPEGPQTLRVIGDFAWATGGIPAEVKRLMALLVYSNVKRPDQAYAARAERIITGDTQFLMVPPDPDEAPTGLPEADDIIRRLRRPERHG